MTIDECYQLGRITKPFGYKGQVIFFLDVDCPEDYADLDSAFVEIKGNLIPYFFKIENIAGNKATVTFEDLKPEEAQALVGHDLYLPLDMLPKLDETHGDIGTIQSIIEYPAQPLFQIMDDGTEILIPVIDPVIKKVDREQKTLFINAPNGLIELYLNK